jgi:uncharacterized protein GlcG (DUF336 family)
MRNLVLARVQISSEAAELAVLASARYARSLNVAVSIAVVDPGGHVVAFQRTDGAPFHTRGIAEDKAATAVSFGVSTRKLAEVLAGHGEHVRSGLQLRPQLVILAGGLPIGVDGQVVGAIGVSGTTEEMDERIAAVGVDAVLGQASQSQSIDRTVK